jgi:site-specific DNA-methyltransferase (cytosine-N4-specific)
MILQGNALEVLKSISDNTIQTCITSPPYYALRRYNTPPQIWDADDNCNHQWEVLITKRPNGTGGAATGQKKIGVNTFQASHHGSTSTSDYCTNCPAMRCELGLEPTVQDYIRHLTQIFTEVRRVLKPDGTMWINIADSYGTVSGSMGTEFQQPKFSVDANKSINFKQSKGGGKHKSLMNIPSRLAISLTDTADLIQRNKIIWHKPNAMPNSAKDRFTVDFEDILFFSKNPRYKFNQQFETITGVTRFMRTVWSINTKPSKVKHFASYPERLVEIPILASTNENDIVLDPFSGTGTTGVVAAKHNRQYIGIELLPEWVEISRGRLNETPTTESI